MSSEDVAVEGLADGLADGLEADGLAAEGLVTKTAERKASALRRRGALYDAVRAVERDDEPLHGGYLLQRTSVNKLQGVGKIWKRRYFLLFPHGLVSYKERGAEPKSAIVLSHRCAVEEGDLSPAKARARGQPDFVFILRNSGHKYQLAASSEEALGEWVSNLDSLLVDLAAAAAADPGADSGGDQDLDHDVFEVDKAPRGRMKADTRFAMSATLGSMDSTATGRSVLSDEDYDELL